METLKKQLLMLCQKVYTIFVGYCRFQKGADMEEKYIVAENIRTAGLWNEADCRRLCELAGLEEEWEEACGEEFEAVVYKAAEILEVEI